LPGRRVLTGLVLQSELKKSLETALTDYQNALSESPAAAYLAGRALKPETWASFGLGFVADPHPGHEMYRGRLAIPYYGTTGILGTIRFKAVDNSSPKILGLPGHDSRPYNVRDLSEDVTAIAVCEGEPDTWTIAQLGVLRVVGVPGAASWNRPMARLFQGYAKVFVLEHSDDKGAGRELSEKIMKSVRNCFRIPAPEGHDWNSLYCEQGEEAVLERLGLS
jgi:DNA primase